MIARYLMNTLIAEPIATMVRFEADAMWLDLADGRQLGVPLACFPRLLRASPAERNAYTLSGGGTGIHWDDLDEDISVSALLRGGGRQNAETENCLMR